MTDDIIYIIIKNDNFKDYEIYKFITFKQQHH